MSGKGCNDRYLVVWLILQVNGRLAMTRSIGDFDLKPYGVTSVPECSYTTVSITDPICCYIEYNRQLNCWENCYK